MKFKAAILTEHNAPLTVDEIEIPDELRIKGLNAGMVLVRLYASGICGAQLGEIAGVKGPDKYMPHLLGHEGAGVVVEVNSAVRSLNKGDHVVCHWRKGQGIESRNPYYNWRGHEIGGGWVTTFNEYALISENRLTRIAKDVPFDIAALMGCAVTTGLGVINNDAQMKFGQSIAVLGCGGVGLNLIQAAAMASAYPIIGIDIQPAKLEMARRFGATHAFTSADQIQEVTERGVDVFVETTGRAELIERAYELTANTGKTILVGQMHWNAKASIQTLPLHAGKTFCASEGGQTNPTTDIPRYLKLWRAGKLQLENLITHRAPLESINELLDTIRAGQVGRAIIEMPA
jgi:S-(hydroxymethyl)glutathione dehydrogenase/alcohol dehydrogenase